MPTQKTKGILQHQENARAAQSSVEQVRFLNLRIAGHHLSLLFAKTKPALHIACLRKEAFARNLSPLFATLPCDERKLRMTAYHGIKACGFLQILHRLLKSDRPEVNIEC